MCCFVAYRIFSAFLALALAFSAQAFAAETLVLTETSFGGSVVQARVCAPAHAQTDTNGWYGFLGSANTAFVAYFVGDYAPPTGTAATYPHAGLRSAANDFACDANKMAFLGVTDDVLEVVVYGKMSFDNVLLRLALPDPDLAYLASYPDSAGVAFTEDFDHLTGSGAIVVSYPKLTPLPVSAALAGLDLDVDDLLDKNEPLPPTPTVTVARSADGGTSWTWTPLELPAGVDLPHVDELVVAGGVAMLIPPAPRTGLLPLNDQPLLFWYLDSGKQASCTAAHGLLGDITVPGSHAALSSDGLRAAVRMPIDGSEDSIFAVVERASTAACFDWAAGGRIVPVSAASVGRALSFVDGVDGSADVLFVGPNILDVHSGIAARAEVLGFDLTGTAPLLSISRVVRISPEAGDQATVMSRPRLASSSPGTLLFYDPGAIFMAPLNHWGDVAGLGACRAPGYWLDGGACTVCPPGTFCDGSSAKADCTEANTFSAEGAHVCAPCPANTHGHASHTKCTASSGYCGEFPAQPIELCPINHYCDGLNPLAQPCTDGTFSQQGSRHCSPLPPNTEASDLLARAPVPFYCLLDHHYVDEYGCHPCSGLVGDAYCAQAFNPARQRVEKCPRGFKILDKARTICSFCKSTEICDGTTGVAPDTFLQSDVFMITMIFSLSLGIGLLYIIGLPWGSEKWRVARADPASAASRATAAADKRRQAAADALRETKAKLAALTPGTPRGGNESPRVHRSVSSSGRALKRTRVKKGEAERPAVELVCDD